MSTDNTEVKTIVELCKEGMNEGWIIAAIKSKGVFHIDKFGILIEIPPNEIVCEIVDQIFLELEGGHEASFDNPQYYAMVEADTPSILNRAGWPESYLPDFKVIVESLAPSLKNSPSPEKAPASQSAVWKILKAALLSEKLNEATILHAISSDANSQPMDSLQMKLGLNGDIDLVTTERIKTHLSKIWLK